MAGIGFELRKMFSESESTFGDLKAISYSTIISVGPWIITAISLNLLLIIAKYYIVLRSERVLFMATVLYAFIFSQILVSPWQYIVTRYLSDCIYEKKADKLRGAFTGTMKLMIILSFGVSALYLISSPLSLFYKGVAVLLFTLLTASWVCMSFVSVLKNYKFVAYSYIVGNGLAVVLAILLTRLSTEEVARAPSTNLLLAYTAGIFVTFIMLSYRLLSTFDTDSESEFAFFRYLKGYSALFFIGLFYTTGVWVHLFINWFKGDYFVISDTFRATPFYEVALFYAFLITIPSMVYFVVFLETKFYPDYKKYYANLSYKGTLTEIKRALENMMAILIREIYYCMELQFFICLSFILTANIIFNYFQMDLYLLELFRVFILGAFCTTFISIFVTIFLYLDARLEALSVSIVYFITNSGLTFLFSFLGEGYTGVGFFLSGFITLIVARQILGRTIKNLTYSTFYRQNFSHEVGSPLLSKIEIFFNRRGYIPLIVIMLIAVIFTGCTRYDDRGFNNKTKHNWHTMSIYDTEYYNEDGYSVEGLDRRGFDTEGWHIDTDSPYDYYGFDKQGVHKDTKTNIDERGFDLAGIYVENNGLYDKNGFDRAGINEETNTEYNKDGWTYYGLNYKTQDYYDENGYSIEGYDREGYDFEGYSIEGYNEAGWNRNGYNEATNDKVDGRGFGIDGINKVTSTKYDERGFDVDGKYGIEATKYDDNGFDVNGINRETDTEYNSDGWNYYGLNEVTQDYYDSDGYSIEGYSIEGFDKRGYNIEGYNAEGYTRRGYDSEGYRRDGWNRRGVFKYTKSKYDFYGFDIRGTHKTTGEKYNEYGFDRNGINKKTGGLYNEDGFNRNGLDKSGNRSNGEVYSVVEEEWDIEGKNIKTKTLYDKDGFNQNGIDRDGFNRKGVYIDE